MRAFTRRQLIQVVVISSLYVCGLARVSAAQMNYSSYADVWPASDGSYVYGYLYINDVGGGGCQGPIEYATASLFSPSGRVANGPGSTSLSFDNDDGTWTLSAEIWVYCYCGGHYMGFPGGTAQEVVRVPTYVAIIGTPAYTVGPPAPYVYNVNREILDQFRRPLTGVRFVDETFTPSTPNGNCTSLPVSTNNANSSDQGIFGPDLYSLPGNAPNPCSSSSVQHFKVAGRDVSPDYDVTWQYSGVTVTPR